MKTLLALFALPFVLSSCSMSTSSQTTFASTSYHYSSSHDSVSAPAVKKSSRVVFYSIVSTVDENYTNMFTRNFMDEKASNDMVSCYVPVGKSFRESTERFMTSRFSVARLDKAPSKKFMKDTSVVIEFHFVKYSMDDYISQAFLGSDTHWVSAKMSVIMKIMRGGAIVAQEEIEEKAEESQSVGAGASSICNRAMHAVLTKSIEAIDRFFSEKGL